MAQCDIEIHKAKARLCVALVRFIFNTFLPNSSLCLKNQTTQVKKWILQRHNAILTLKYPLIELKTY